MRFFQRACGVYTFLASSVSYGVTNLRPHLYCLPSRFTIVRFLYWVLGLCGVSPVFSVAFAPIARTIPASVLVLPMWRFFRRFRATFGDFCSCLRNFSASASIPWLRLWCDFSCSVCLFSAYLYPPVAGLVGFSCGPTSLVVHVCVWSFLSEAAELSLLSLLLLGVG